jgi:CubicO group peptidase (beta-lactamase class C family)
MSRLTPALLAIVPAASVLVLVLGVGPRLRPSDLSARIRAVENGLSLNRTISGRPGLTLRERMAHYNVPGVSIAVVNNGRLEWAQGYGVLDAGGSRRVTPQTRFQAASLSKPVTAMAVLALVSQETLRLDDDVNTRLTSWRVPDGEFTRTQKVTVERLLNHTAGFGVPHFDGYSARAEVPTLLQVLNGQPPANSAPVWVERVPGSKREYSGGGYVVLQQLLSDITGESFPVALRRLVLDRIGMAHSTFDQHLPDDWKARAASGHDSNGAPLEDRWRIYPEMAAAGLWTTPSDLARVIVELQRSMKGRSNRLFRAEMTARMVTQAAGSEALGFSAWGDGKNAVFSHGGANNGFRTMLFAYAHTGRGAVVMANGDDADALLTEILRSIAAEYGWPDYRPTVKTVVPLDPAIGLQYAGRFEVDGTPIAVTYEGQQLFLQTPAMGPTPLKLYPSGEHSFFVLEGDIDVTFARDRDGHVTSLEVHALGASVRAPRVD